MAPHFSKLAAGERRIRYYGWTPDLPDHRDLTYAAPHAVAKALPAHVDMTAQCPAIYDQGQLGSCTGNSIAGAVQFEQLKLKIPDFNPSRLFIYYNERVIEHTVTTDAGAQIRDGIKSVANLGVCSEELWPYSDENTDPDPCPKCPYAKKPTPECYTAAKKTTVTLYQRLTPILNTLKGCLAEGYPFVFGFTVYQSFESEEVEKTGIVPMPAPDEQTVGGHAVLAVGYDDAKQQFIIRNSWGTSWGKKGYFRMPYAYLTDPNLADDFWTIRGLTAPSK